MEGKFIKKTITVIITIILSTLYIFLGNKIATKDFDPNAHVEQFETATARVVEITDRIDNIVEENGEEYNLGTRIVFKAKILSGPLKGQITTGMQEIDLFFAVQPKEAHVGAKLLLMPNGDYTSEISWVLLEYVRTDYLILLGVVFCLVLIFFGRFQGVYTIVSLLYTCLSIFMVFIPAILSSKNIYFWSILTCVFIIVMTLLIVSGTDKKSLAAGIGCFSGVLVSGTLTLLMGRLLQMTGILNEESVYLQMMNPDNPIDVKAIMFAGIIIGAIGAIMDVAMSISSALMEVYEVDRSKDMKGLFRSGINIGRDIMGTMANTLVLAYIGSSLSLTLLLIAYSNSIYALLNREMIIKEILQAMVGSFGILMTIPLTSLICAFLYTRVKKPSSFRDKLELALGEIDDGDEE